MKNVSEPDIKDYENQAARLAQTMPGAEAKDALARVIVSERSRLR
jgi:hypothetical protein